MEGEKRREKVGGENRKRGGRRHYGWYVKYITTTDFFNLLIFSLNM